MLTLVTVFTAEPFGRSYLSFEKSSQAAARTLEEDPTMKTKKRSLLMATAFAAAVAAGLTGLSISGESKQASPDQACAHVTWPMIPARCLKGADSHRIVRPIVTRTAVEHPQTMAARFALAFN